MAVVRSRELKVRSWQVIQALLALTIVAVIGFAGLQVVTSQPARAQTSEEPRPASGGDPARPLPPDASAGGLPAADPGPTDPVAGADPEPADPEPADPIAGDDPADEEEDGSEPSDPELPGGGQDECPSGPGEACETLFFVNALCTSAIRVEVFATFIIATVDDVRISVTIDGVVSGPFPADYADGFGWGYFERFDVTLGTHVVAVTVEGDVATGDTFTASFDDTVNTDCVDVTVSCSSVDAVQNRGSEEWSFVELNVTQLDPVTGTPIAGPESEVIPSPTTPPTPASISLLGANSLSTPGRFLYEVIYDDYDGGPMLLKSGEFYCVELAATTSCVGGDVAVDLSRGADAWVDALAASVSSVTVNGVAPTSGSWANYQWVFASPPTTITIDVVHSLTGVVVPAPSEIPVCQVSVAIVCNFGYSGIEYNLTGTPTGTAVVETPALFTLNPGDAVNVSINNGVHFTDNDAASVDFTVPRCDLYPTVICGLSGGLPSGDAVLSVDTSFVPAGTVLTSDNGTPGNSGDDVVIADGDTIPPGVALTLSVNNGVVFQGYFDSAALSAAPNCTVAITANALCSAGLPQATIGVSAGEYTISIANGSLAGGFTYDFDDPTQPMTVTLLDTASTPANVLVLPSNPYVIDPPTCQVVAAIVCGSGEASPGRAVFIIDLSDAPAGTTIDNSGVELTTGDLVTDGDTLTLTINNGVYFADSGNDSTTITAPYCTITVTTASLCVAGAPIATITASTGDYTITAANGTETSPGTYSFDDPTADITFTLAASPTNVVIAPTNPITVTPFTCSIIADIVCGSGASTGLAIFTTDLTNTPPGTTITDGTIGPLAPPDPGTVQVENGETITAGESITLTVNNGVFFIVTASSSITLTAPYCTISVTTTSLCIAGVPHATITASTGVYTITAANGTETSPGTYRIDDLSTVITFSLTTTPINAAVLPTNPIDVEPLTCEIDAYVECQSGAAVLRLVGLAGTPADTTVTSDSGTPGDADDDTTVANGDIVTQASSFTLSVDQGVVFGTTGDSATPVTAPACSVPVEIVCGTGEGGPTGQAVVRADLTGTPEGTAVGWVPAVIVGGDDITITLNNPNVHFSASGSPSIMITAPQCRLALTAQAVCIAGQGTIEVSVTAVGAPAETIIVNGVQAPADASGVTTINVDAAILYTVNAVAVDPSVQVESPPPFPATAPCIIEITITATCMSATEVNVMVTTTAATTGTVATISVNGDSSIPYTVAPGTDIIVTITSDDTFADDIMVPAAIAPSDCAPPPGEGTPAASRLFVSYAAECVAEDTVQVQVTTAGTPIVLGISVNGDGFAPYLVAPGAPITVVVLSVGGTSEPIISGPAFAPDCAATIEPVIPQETTPAILITIPPRLLLPNPVAVPDVPEPTPSPTPTAEPTPTPTPTTDPTSEPEPSAPPTPEPQPTAPPVGDPAAPDPTPEPPTIPDTIGVRQSGRSVVLLPAVCDVESIEIPGAVTLTRTGVDAEGMVQFSAEGANLDVGTYRQTILCAGNQVDVELFVYRQIGGARGEGNSVSSVAALGLALTAVLVGVPGLVRAGRKSTQE